MEEELFKKYKVNYNKLLEYGFKLEDDKYLYSTNILDNSFRVDITITDKVVGKVIDLEFNDEYNNFRMSEIGSFAGKVKNEYENILLDIRNKCFVKEYFIFSQSNRITNYIINKYNDEPEFLWEKLDGCGVFRNKNSNKWYSIIMNVDKSKITDGNGEIEVMNLKLDRNQIENLLNEKGYYKAYHMNKKDWISIILDDTLSDKIICNLIDESYNNVNEKEYWIVPANPKYYDIVNCFNDKDEIIWKQSTDVHINDIVYIYVGIPYSRIFYKCSVIEVNIPYKYESKELKMDKVMKLKLVEKYDDKYTFKFLNNIGIKAIRGPIKISKIESNKIG